MNWSDLRTLLGLARREFQLGTRGPCFWAMIGLGGLYALWRALGSDGLLALACFQIVQFAVVGLGLAGVLLGGMAAGRDVRERAQQLVLAKPVGNRPLLVVARLLGAWLSLLAVVVAMLAVVLVVAAFTGGHPWGFATYGNALARSALPLALATALGFTLTTLFATPLASALAAIYWVSVPLARAHVSSVFDVTVAQHGTMVLLLALALVAVSGWKYGKSIAGINRPALGLVAVALLAIAGLSVLQVLGRGDDALGEPDPLLAAMSGQSVEQDDRAPGFWLMDARRRLVGLDDFAGRPAVLLFWAPSNPASVSSLLALRTLAQHPPVEGLACIAVCVDHDAATLAPFAREVGGSVTMVQDEGRHFFATQPTLDSALVTAYGVEETPAVFLLDTQRHVLGGTRGLEPADLERAVTDRLAPGGKP